MQKIIIVTSFILATSSYAHAADAIMHHDPVPVVYDTGNAWTGGYIGLDAGYQNSRFNEHFNGQFQKRNKSNNFLGGIYGGYNFEFTDKIILGMEGNFTYNNASHSNSYSTTIASATYDFSHKSKLKWSAALRARLGYSMDRWMPYIAAGVATAQVKNSIYDINANHQNRNTNMTGWTAGAGIDYAFATNTVLRLEYRHSDYGKKSFAINNFNYKTKVKTDEIRIGVAYHF